MMPSESELLSYWEPDQLKRWSEELLRKRGFSGEDSEYLSRIGLPRTNDWSWEIGEQVDDLPTAGPSGALVTVALDTMVVPICADLSKAGQIVAIEDVGTFRFVNSSVRHFGACLYHYRRIAYFDRAQDREKDLEVFRELLGKIVDLDPPAVAETQNLLVSDTCPNHDRDDVRVRSFSP